MLQFINDNIGVIGLLCGAVAAYYGAYNAIRVDLAVARERADAAKDSADKAHARIDSILSSQ